jgi:prepilin-type N-terminal cleavage/methylation domain-containing protein
MCFYRHNHSGFTLVETMLVVIIVGLLASLAVPNMLAMIEMIRLRGAADIIKRELIVARTRAIADPYVHCGVLFDTASRPQRVMIFFDRGTSYAIDTTDTVNKYMGVNTVAKGISLRIPSTSGITDKIVVFRGDGSAKRGGNIQLVNRFNRVKTIRVQESTGRVKVQ